MPLSNTMTTYGTVTKTFHWLTALLILTVIPLGIIAHDLPYDTSEQLALKARLFSMHKTIGVTIFFVALARIAWSLTQTRPGLLNADKKAESFAAQLVHWLLYASLVLVPLTGWIHHSATTGFAPIWWPFGQSLPFVPKDNILAERFATFHMLFERVMVVSLALHIAGALKHHVLDKDATLRRMWFGSGDMPNVPPTPHASLPAVVAAAIFVAVGTVAALQPVHESKDRSVALEEVASEWQVQEGTIGLTVTQFGSPVQGTFADWTSAITFNPDTPDEVKGSVTTTISIGSLTLGSVTDQAMGPDFFDQGQFPTAVFTADIKATDQGYLAEGTLQIKDVVQPLSLPFDLQITDGVAQMSGQVTLDRLDFNVGQSMPDESSLNFAVQIDIALTANRG